MKKLASTLPNMVIVLTTVTLVAAGLLGVMQQLTKDAIAQIEKQTLEDGIKKVMLAGGDGTLTVVGTDEVESAGATYTVYTAEVNGSVIGKAVKTTVSAFSPGLTILTGFDNDGAILGYEILATAETPGLGAKAGTWFQKGQKGDIIGMNPGQQRLSVTKDGGNVDAITASTITSRAFLRAINMEYDVIAGAQPQGTTGATVREGEPQAPAVSAVLSDNE